MTAQTVRRRGLSTSIAAVLSLIAGCIITIEPDPPAPPPDTTIELVNQTAFVLDANFFISASATDDTALFVQPNIYTEYSTRVSRTLGPNETATFTLGCDLIQTIGVRKPVFSAQIGIAGGTSDDVLFLSRDVEYSCGDTLRFVYFVEGESFRVVRQ